MDHHTCNHGLCLVHSELGKGWAGDLLISSDKVATPLASLPNQTGSSYTGTLMGSISGVRAMITRFIGCSCLWRIECETNVFSGHRFLGVGNLLRIIVIPVIIPVLVLLQAVLVVG